MSEFHYLFKTKLKNNKLKAVINGQPLFSWINNGPDNNEIYVIINSAFPWSWPFKQSRSLFFLDGKSPQSLQITPHLIFFLCTTMPHVNVCFSF